MMPDIAFFYVDLGGDQYRRLIANLIASVRATMPGARIVHVTDGESEPAEGVDICARLAAKVERSNLTCYRVAVQSVYMHQTDRPVVWVDPDIEFKRSVADVFDGSFDVGVIKFVGKHGMPFNTGMVYATPEARPFFDEWRRAAEGLPQAVWGWWGDQISLAEVVGQSMPIGATIERLGCRVRVFDALDHAPIPKDAQSRDPYAIHYKGMAKMAFGGVSIPKDLPTTREQGGFLWPVEDSASSVASFRDLNALEKVMSLVGDFSCAIQAGGNCGVWPKALGQKFRTVYTFEPEPRNFYCLVRNVPEAHIIKLPCALGDKPGRGGLAGAVANCGAYYVDGDGIIPIMAIDDLRLATCGLIYLDIEGYEPFALAGAADTIKRLKPIVAFEDKGHCGNYDLPEDATRALMAELGYEIIGKVNRDVIMAHREQQRMAAE